jgi:hypothetical protein
MPDSPLQAEGAAIQPTASAALHNNEYFTGMWTQGNPLGPGAVPYVYQKFYSALRYDRLVGGKNVEVTTRLTLGRRPGNSVYNAGPFPPLNRFYEFRSFTGGSEQIHIMGSFDPATGLTQGTVRDVTGPANNRVLWTKDSNAGRTSFQSVGNIVYFADGVDAKKWIQSKLVWKANSSDFAGGGDFIIDSNNNIQVSIESQTARIAQIQVTTSPIPGPPFRHRVYLFFDPSTPLDIDTNTALLLAGLTTLPALNGLTVQCVVLSSLQVYFNVLSGFVPITPLSAETGTATTGTGITGAVQPVWAAATGDQTQDGTQQWICKGSAVQDWGTDAAPFAPIVTQQPSPSIYDLWAANTFYSPLFVILDSNGNLQQLQGAGGTTGGAAPVWSAVIGAITADNTCNWKCLGPSAWAGTHAYAVNDCVLVQFTYFITTPVVTYVWQNGVQVAQVTYIQTPVTVTQLFQCTQAGISATSEPSWTSGVNTTTVDNTVVWINKGTAPAWPGAAQKLSTKTTILDANGYLQQSQGFGETGAAVPVWETDLGATTIDNGQRWINVGSFAPAMTAAVIYAYSPKNSITGHIGTASALSQPITVGPDYFAVIQGGGFADPQDDTIVLWRTVQGGSTLLYDDEFPNPGAGQSWIYTDTHADRQLNELITAPISHSNDRPQAGFTPQCYYLTRIWGFVGNDLVYSGGPDTLTGSGNESFPPNNRFTFPSIGVKCWPTSIGLIVYTNSDVWAILGQGTANSPFYVVSFQQGVGLANQDAIDVNGSTGYGMLSSSQVVSMDPGAGELEVGFPIGDQFDSLYDSQEVYIAWHQGSSSDMGLYVADGSTGWFRMASVAAPESGHVWSPFAEIVGGVKAIASMEIAPGDKRLLLGPAAQGKPILMRDPTTHLDALQPYQAFVNIGAIVLAKPGTVVGVQFITCEETLINGATPLAVGVLFDEISGAFTNLVNTSVDPPTLPASKTTRATRFWTSQDGGTIQKCRYMQQQLSWPAEDKPNELLTNTVFGRLAEKARK